MSRRTLRRALAAAAVMLCAQASQASAAAWAQPGAPLSSRLPVAAQAVATELDVQPAALTPTDLTSLLDRLRADHISTVSTGVNWGSVQPSPAPSAYDWGSLDRLVQQARARGLRIRLRVAGSPAWLHPGVPSADAGWYPPVGPAQLAAWSAFLTDLTQRYGSLVSAVEIWNEPNEAVFWQPAPDPSAFAALMRTSYLAVKHIAPGLTVTSGGLSHNDLGFLSAFYDAAGRLPDARVNNWYFDQLGLHPYSSDRSPDLALPSSRYRGSFGIVDENFTGMRDMVALMTAREGRSKHVWISEFGYSTASTAWIPAVPDARRAYFLLRAYSQAGSLGFVDGLGWYHSHPTPWDPAGYDILTPAGVTDTYQALRQVTGAAPRPSPLAITLPPTVRGTQTIAEQSTGLAQTPGSMELYVDGALVARGIATLSWDSRSVPDGDHLAQLVAWTGDGATHMSAVTRIDVTN